MLRSRSRKFWKFYLRLHNPGAHLRTKASRLTMPWLVGIVVVNVSVFRPHIKVSENPLRSKSRHSCRQQYSFSAALQVTTCLCLVVGRNTTLFPCIKGLMPLICMVFTPVMELRTDPNYSRFTGALCGLGSVPGRWWRFLRCAGLLLTHVSAQCFPWLKVHSPPSMDGWADANVWLLRNKRLLWPACGDWLHPRVPFAPPTPEAIC